MAIVSLGLGLTYGILLGGMAGRQRQLIYRPRAEHSLLPSDVAFHLDYQSMWIPIAGSSDRLHAWWLPRTEQSYVVLPNEPHDTVPPNKVVLYLCGVGRNMGDYNYLARASAFRQLGFSVLMFDYRGYGRSDGDFPHESQLYADAAAAWNYLINEQGIAAADIVIYGESLGGAIALDLALQHPDAAALILQSSFTSMADAIQQKLFTRLFPVEQILTERFDSLGRIGRLQVPVLFLHGEADSVVPAAMSQHLYAAAPEPKQIFLIPGADHVSIYQPKDDSYLKAIASFVGSLPER